MDLFGASQLLLMTILDMSLEEVSKLISMIAEKVAPSSSSAYQMLESRYQSKCFLTTGIDQLDTFMKGGIPIGMISEISGSPGTGKTQFCLGCLAELVVSYV